MAQLNRAGVFGGTFDPPHRGHIAIAERALYQLNLDVVWWLPAGSPPHKLEQDVSPVDHRFTMVRLTLETTANPAFSLLTTDRDRPGPHYMVDTIEILRDQYHPDVMFLIIGEDTLYDLPDWSRPAELAASVQFAVYPRGGHHPSLSSLNQALPGIKDKVTWLTGDRVEMSSTLIREKAHDAHALAHLVIPEVAEYITTHNLYSKSYAQ